MKKRTLALLLALVMSFSLLTACGGKDDSDNASSAPVDEPSFSADLAEFYNSMMAAAQEPPFMMDLAAEAEMLEALYPGLAAIETNQLVAVSPAMSAVAMEFVFVEVVNASDVDAVKTILQTRIDTQVDGGAWYPETIAQWEQHSEIIVIDNYVCLFVCSDKDILIDSFRNGTEIPTWAIPAVIEDEYYEEDLIEEEDFVEESAEPVESTPASAPVESAPAETTPASAPVESAPVESVPAAASVDLYAFLVELANTYGENFPANMSLAEVPEYLDAFYPGLTAIEANQMHIYQPMMSSVVCEIALIEVANAADMDAVKAILEARIESQGNGGGAWYPESIDGWINDSRIVTNGNYVMMIAWMYCDEAVEAFNALF